MNSSNINREKNEMLCMRFKIRVLHKAYKQVFKQLYTPLWQDLQNKSEFLQRDHNRITSK
jgi:DNA-binding ferritin-like protein (Dps family)